MSDLDLLKNIFDNFSVGMFPKDSVDEEEHYVIVPKRLETCILLSTRSRWNNTWQKKFGF